MSDEYPSDWSEADRKAAEMDTPSWKSDTSMDEQDRELLQGVLNRNKRECEQETIGVPDSIDPDI